MKIFKNKSLLILTISVLFLGSCTTVDSSVGPKVDHKIDANGFTAIEISNSGIVNFTESNTTSVILNSSKEIFDIMEFEVVNSILKIRTKNGVIITNSKENLVTITAPNVNSFKCSGSGELTIINTLPDTDSDFSLDVSGSGSIRTNYIIANRLQFDVSGSGEIEVDSVSAENSQINISGSGEIAINGGATDYTNITLKGSGDYNGYNFISKHVTVKVSGSGEAQLIAEATLQGSISGSGSITYKGNPIIDINESGSGELINGH